MYANLFNLIDHVVIVTGGAGHLGREISRGLADFGARVVAIGRNRDKLAAVKAPNIECVACDVQNEAAFAKLAAKIHQRHGRLDGLVNNANAAQRESWDELNAAAWRAGLDATLNHYFTCTKIVSRYMLAAGKGAI